MKILESLLLCGAFCSMPAYAQPGEAPTPETSLEDTQRWIVDKLHEIGAVTDGDGANRKDIFFEGCLFTETLASGAIAKNNGRLTFRVTRGSLADLSERVTQGVSGQTRFLQLETSGGGSFPTNWGVSYDPALMASVVVNGDPVATVNLLKATLDPNSEISKAAAAVYKFGPDSMRLAFGSFDQATQERLLNAFIQAGKLCRAREGRVIGRIGVVWGQNVTRELAVASGLPAPTGALVAQIEPGSPADKAGMLGGDIITVFDGKNAGSSAELTDIIRTTRPGTRVDVQVVRDKAVKTLSLTVGTRPAAGPGITGLGPLRPYANVTFLRDQWGSNVERSVRFSEDANGVITIVGCDPSGENCGRYVAAPSASNPRQYDLLESFYEGGAKEWMRVNKSVAWNDGVLTFRYSESWNGGWFNLEEHTSTLTNSYWVQGGRVMQRETRSLSWDHSNDFAANHELRVASESSLNSAREAQEENRRYRAEYEALTKRDDASAGQAFMQEMAKIQNNNARIADIHNQAMANIQAQAEERNRMQQEQADRMRAQERSRQRAHDEDAREAAAAREKQAADDARQRMQGLQEQAAARASATSGSAAAQASTTASAGAAAASTAQDTRIKLYGTMYVVHYAALKHSRNDTLNATLVGRITAIPWTYDVPRVHPKQQASGHSEAVPDQVRKLLLQQMHTRFADYLADKYPVCGKTGKTDGCYGTSYYAQTGSSIDEVQGKLSDALRGFSAPVTNDGGLLYPPTISYSE